MMLNTCKNCEEAGLIVNYAEGNIVCRFCGMVQDLRIIDETSEWRNFAKESSSTGGGDSKRVGEANNDLLPDRGICTIISSNGPKESSLTRWNQRTIQGGSEKSLSRGFRSIDDLGAILDLSDIIKEEAKRIFKSIDENKSLKGRTHNSIIAACVFIACRKKNTPRSIKEISLGSNIERKDILKCYSTIKKTLPQVHNNKSAADYAKRFAILLMLSEESIRNSQKIAEKVIEKGLAAGKSPLSIASASVYLVARLSGEDRTWQEISKVSTMKEMTIKSCYKEIQGEIEKTIERVKKV